LASWYADAVLLQSNWRPRMGAEFSPVGSLVSKKYIPFWENLLISRTKQGGSLMSKYNDFICEIIINHG
jgi:hypothetical protein